MFGTGKQIVTEKTWGNFSLSSDQLSMKYNLQQFLKMQHILCELREVAMQPVLDQQKLKALVYYIEVTLHFFSLGFWAFCFERFSWITCLESEIQSRNSWCHWGIGQWVKYFDLIISVFFQVLTSISITGTDGVQFIASHIVQEKGGRALGAAPTICQNSKRVAGVQRQQSSIQGIPLCALVVCDIFRWVSISSTYAGQSVSNSVL